MQFGILIYPFTVLADLASSRYCIPMDSPRPILPAELEFFNKGTGRGKSPYCISSCNLLVLERLFTLDYCYLLSIGQLPTKSKYFFTVPVVVIFTKFDGQIASEYANLTDANDEDKWERARDLAKITFHKVYLPKVLNAKYPPKAYVQLEGESDRAFFQKNGSNVVS